MGRLSTNGVCSVEWCNSKIRSKGLCKRHYEQTLSHGHILPIVKNRSEPNEIRVGQDYSEVVILDTDGEVKALVKVDNDNVEMIRGIKWYIQNWYACGIRDGKPVRMHRMILKTDLEVDHINRVRTDNRVSNLRSATKAQNAANRVKRKNNTTGYKGVFIYKKSKRFLARIICKGEKKHLGIFENAIDAAMAYDRAAHEEFGSYAKLNFNNEAV